jgi:integrase
MIDVSLYLKRPKEDAETVIFARVCYDGRRLKYYLPEKIKPCHWSYESQRAKQSSKFKEHPEFNQRLNSIVSEIANAYRQYVNDNNGKVPETSELKNMLDRRIRDLNKIADRKDSFLGFFISLIEQTSSGTRLNPLTGKPISQNTLRTYKTTYKHLNNFQLARKKLIEFDSIDLNFYDEFTRYLMADLNLSTNTVGKNIQVLKLVLNEATDRGLNKNLAYKSRKFVPVREKTESIYLSEDEIHALAELNLTGNKRLESVRDLFLIGCHTGLRYSDYSILDPSKIVDGFIETVQIKTGEPVVIPIHATVQRIIAKYDGTLPASISNQKTNQFLKEVGKKLDCFQTSVTIAFTKGGKKVVETLRKWELLTTHTARRSFATNEYSEGTPTLTIMAITGHKTEKAFLRYIKLSRTEHAKLMKLHWDQRAQLRAV